MNIARGPINRPILTFVVYLIIITLGIISLSRLSIDLMPEVTYPTISVITSYENVGPQEMEELITRPIEEALAAVQNVEEITSSSTEGRSLVRVSFAWGTDLDVAANDIRDRIDRVLGRLPDDIARPMIRKFDLSAFPIMFIGVASKLHPLDLRQIVEDQIKYRIERVPGVAAIDIRGGLYREIHIDLKAEKLKALGISPLAIISALQSENQNIPAGLFDKGNFEVLIRTKGEFESLPEIENTVLLVRQGTPILVRDVAEVKDAWEEVRQIVRIDGVSGLTIAINKQSGSNTVTVAEAVNAEIARINRDIPQIHLAPIMDTSRYIKQSISNVGNSAILGGILAILILFLFLRNFSSTAIIATAIPISIIATFGLMYFGGFTLNIITFGGLALGIGMLVDCSIVVLENIYRHQESGVAPIESALIGTKEVWAAIMASTLTTIVVFFPVVFLRGMSGIMFQQMAYVVTFSLLCSLIVATTLIPMISSKFLRLGKKDKSNKWHKIYALSGKALQQIESEYAKILNWALTHKKTVIIATLILFAISVFLVRFIGVELMPAADEGEVRIDMEMAVGTRLEVIDQAAKTVENIVRQSVPEMKSIMSRIGAGGFRSSGGHTAELRITLVDKKDRSHSSEEIANDLRRKLANLPGVIIRTRAGQGLFLLRMGSSDAENVTVEIRGYDLTVANHLAQRVEQAIKEVPGITDTKISREEGSPEQIIRIDRFKAADLGLSISKIGDALQTTVGGTQASYYRESGKQYRILVRLSEQDRLNLDDLLDLTVVNDRGEPIILRNVVQAIPNEGPARIERKDQERVININANYTGRDMGSIISDIREKIQHIPVPKDFAIMFGGDYEEQQKAFKELLFGFILAIFLVYLVMAGQFESLIDPFVVLFSIPMALIGVTITMILTGTIFSMQAFIGCIMLAGIVVNNAILLVDCTNQIRQTSHLSLIDAAKLAGSRRLRPILMTTLTTVLGLLPLSFGWGEGGEAQAPLARVVIGGLLSSTLITLVLIPVIYVIFEQKLRRKNMRTS